MKNLRKLAWSSENPAGSLERYRHLSYETGKESPFLSICPGGWTRELEQEIANVRCDEIVCREITQGEK